MAWADRWGGSHNAHPQFADGYCAVFTTDELARDLARLRLLAPTVNLIVRAASNVRCAAEARPWMRYWRGDPAAPAWTSK